MGAPDPIYKHLTERVAEHAGYTIDGWYTCGDDPRQVLYAADPNGYNCVFDPLCNTEDATKLVLRLKVSIKHTEREDQEDDDHPHRGVVIASINNKTAIEDYEAGNMWEAQIAFRKAVVTVCAYNMDGS